MKDIHSKYINGEKIVINDNSSQKDKLVYTGKRIFGTETEFGDKRPTAKRFKRHFVENGGLLYYDCGHVEYASPETSNARDAVLYSKAGELVATKRFKKTFYKNNTDSKGSSYGAHESYFMDFSFVKTDDLLTLVPFLMTRQLYTGNGLFIDNNAFYISQKSRFINSIMSNSSTNDRPLVHTKLESHAYGREIENWNRLHLICGDANMCEVAEYLKLGITSLVLELLEKQKIPKLVYNSDKVISSLHSINVHTSDWQSGCIPNIDNATDVQRRYLDAVVKHLSGRDTMTDDIINRWHDTLNKLDEDPMQLFGVVDWVTKKSIIDQYAQKNSRTRVDALHNINLQYHDTNRKGLFYTLQKNGHIERILTDEEIEHAANNPPADTRANYRGALVSILQTRKNSCRHHDEHLDWKNYSQACNFNKTHNKFLKTKRLRTDFYDPFNPYEKDTSYIKKLLTKYKPKGRNAKSK